MIILSDPDSDRLSLGFGCIQVIDPKGIKLVWKAQH